jgi:hypothetical protein
MKARSELFACLVYLGVVAVAILGFGTSMFVLAGASKGSLQAAAREKTMLDVRIEDAREIKRALAKSVDIPPLPPITARPLREKPTTVAQEPTQAPRAKPSQAALNAMAMQLKPEARSSAPAFDRHSANY